MKTISRICAVASAVGMMTALSACAGSGLIKVTHSDTPYRGGYQEAPSTVAKAQPVVKQAKTPEVQVAVMATLPKQTPPKRSVFIHR
jgi:hypothetical protein